MALNAHVVICNGARVACETLLRIVFVQEKVEDLTFTDLPFLFNKREVLVCDVQAFIICSQTCLPTFLYLVILVFIHCLQYIKQTQYITQLCSRLLGNAANSHHVHSPFSPLLLARRYKSLKSHSTISKSSFFTTVIRLLIGPLTCQGRIPDLPIDLFPPLAL